MLNFLKKLFAKDTTETISDQIVEDTDGDTATATTTNANFPNVSPLYSITAGSGGGIGGGIITGGISTGSGGGIGGGIITGGVVTGSGGGGGVTYASASNYTNGKVFSASGSFTPTFGIVAGETFDDYKDLFTTNIDLANFHNQFHFSVWQELFGEITDYGFTRVHSDMPPKILLVFNSKKNRDGFLKWLDGYKLLFPNNDISDVNLPQPVEGYVEGTLIILPEQGDIISIWAWIISNCHNKVTHYGYGRWLFENNSEATMFKMRFS